MNEMISVIEAGQQLQRRKTTIFKTMKRLGIHAHKRRDASSGNQIVSFLTADEFQRIKQELHSRSTRPKAADDENDDSFVSTEIGVFYVIQLEPEHDPCRFKVGFAASLDERLRTLRCSAPFSKVVKCWPCRRLWERTAIDCVTTDCEQLHTEVFRCSSLDTVLGKCEQFFGMMPVVRANDVPIEFSESMRKRQNSGDTGCDNGN